MKNLGRIIFISSLFVSFVASLYPQNIKPYATVIDAWVVDNVLLDGKKGIEIHIKVDTYNHGTFEAYASFLFFLEDGSTLKDFNGEYVAGNGQVAASAAFTPSSSEASDEIVVFIPYEEMHVKGAKANLKCLSIIYDYKWRRIAISDYLYFSVNDE